MKCCNCGRENVEEANFCFYCGYGFRENVADADINRRVGEIQLGAQTPVVQPVFSQGKVLKTWQWVLYFMLLIIPYAWPVWLVLTIMWCFSEKATEERRSFARGLMLFVGIAVALSMFVAMYLIATLGTDGAISYLTDGMATSADALMKMYGM